jgi:hypothetical protein
MIKDRAEELQSHTTPERQGIWTLKISLFLFLRIANKSDIFVKIVEFENFFKVFLKLKRVLNTYGEREPMTPS